MLPSGAGIAGNPSKYKFSEPQQAIINCRTDKIPSFVPTSIPLFLPAENSSTTLYASSSQLSQTESDPGNSDHEVQSVSQPRQVQKRNNTRRLRGSAHVDARAQIDESDGWHSTGASLPVERIDCEQEADLQLRYCEEWDRIWRPIEALLQNDKRFATTL